MQAEADRCYMELLSWLSPQVGLSWLAEPGTSSCLLVQPGLSWLCQPSPSLPTPVSTQSGLLVLGSCKEGFGETSLAPST